MINVTFHSPTRALLFSDLHYSYKTKDTCFEVLRFINKYAQENHCRVYFLGDFWDHIYRRGTVPVDLLNEMVRFFHKEWHCAMTMIPGNHCMTQHQDYGDHCLENACFKNSDCPFEYNCFDGTCIKTYDIQNQQIRMRPRLKWMNTHPFETTRYKIQWE